MTSDNPESNNRSGFFKTLKNIFKNTSKNNNNIYDANAYEKLDTSRQDMIRGIFELSDVNVREIMIPRVDTVAIDSNTDLKPLVAIVNNAGHSRLPVYEDTIDNIIGILYAKDLIKLLADKPKKFLLKKILHEPYFVPETMTLKELLYEFKKRKLHLAVVVDEYGGMGGIVTLEDILEEIVGEIKDEFDSDELPELERIGKNVFEVDSRMTISDFNEKLGLTIPAEEFDTIGGFIFDQFGKIPKKNETVKYENINFKIKEINGTKINRIIVTLSDKK